MIFSFDGVNYKLAHDISPHNKAGPAGLEPTTPGLEALTMPFIAKKKIMALTVSYIDRFKMRNSSINICIYLTIWRNSEIQSILNVFNNIIL
jgi:hypothetical protein